MQTLATISAMIMSDFGISGSEERGIKLFSSEDGLVMENQILFIFGLTQVPLVTRAPRKDTPSTRFSPLGWENLPFQRNFESRVDLFSCLL
jgi:hypothetical protein